MIGVVALLGLLGVALLGFSIAALFGQVSTPVGPVHQHLSPSDLASSAVAGATLMLAAFTAYLALETRASVAATRREAAIAEQALSVGAEGVRATNRHASAAEQALEASWRPILADVPWGYKRPYVQGTSMAGFDAAEIKTDMMGGHIWLVMPLRNVGSGPAFITRAVLAHEHLKADATAYTTPIVGVHDVVRVTFRHEATSDNLKALSEAILAWRPVVVTVFYGSQGGAGRWRSQFYLKHMEQGNQYGVEQVELYAGDDNVPLATTGAAGRTII